MLPEEPSAATTESTTVVPLSTDFCADDADVIIRAAGTLDFHVHKATLSFVSPFFKDMLTIPQSPTTTPETLPRVDVEESPETWKNVLQTIYPVPSPTLGVLGELQSLLLAAKKYEMQFVIDSHKKKLEDCSLIWRVPLRLYAIACACGIDDEAKYVARHADLPTVINATQDQCLDTLTSALYHRLISFLFARDAELQPILEEGWKSFDSYCRCTLVTRTGQYLYKLTKEELKKPYSQTERVYLLALEDRSNYYDRACDGSECSIMAAEIERFLEGMFQERERVCNKFIWG